MRIELAGAGKLSSQLYHIIKVVMLGFELFVFWRYCLFALKNRVLSEIELANARRFMLSLKFLNIVNIGPPPRIEVNFFLLHGCRLSASDHIAFYFVPRGFWVGVCLLSQLIEEANFRSGCYFEFSLSALMLVVSVLSLDDLLFWVAVAAGSHIFFKAEVVVGCAGAIDLSYVHQ